jgi:hypothetical protein
MVSIHALDQIGASGVGLGDLQRIAMVFMGGDLGDRPWE